MLFHLLGRNRKKQSIGVSLILIPFILLLVLTLGLGIQRICGEEARELAYDGTAEEVLIMLPKRVSNKRPFCGSDIDPSDIFCSNCGRKLKGEG